MKYFNVLIRVCKSIQWLNSMDWWNKTIIQETIKADSKEEAKKIIIEKYPNFFQNDKIYTRETKDEAQFFYVLLYEYSSWSIKEWQQEWECAFCWKKHPNSIEHEHIKSSSNKFPWKYFCRWWNPRKQYWEEDDFIENLSCFDWYEKEFYKNNNIEDNNYYVSENSKYYIYKITEKKTLKSYIWQTRNEPFFRWWQHLSHSKSPFWIYLRQTNLNEWIFEVLEQLSHSTKYYDVLKKESEFIVKYDSINNWFNSVISNKNVL